MIDKKVKLEKHMIIIHDIYKQRKFRILKVMRKNVSVLTTRALPQIDRPQKVLISKIYSDFSLEKKRKFEEVKGSQKGKQKTIKIKSKSGVISTIEIGKDRDPQKFLKNNAPSFTFIEIVK